MRDSHDRGEKRESLEGRAARGRGWVEDLVRIVKGDRESTWDELLQDHREAAGPPPSPDTDELEPVTRI